MEFKALDKNFNLVGLLNPSNVQWNRKYYEHGTFSISIQENQYNENMMYIYTMDRPEIGIIQKKLLEEKNTGTVVQLSGFFLERVLNDKIIYPTFYGNGEITDVLKKMVNQFKEDIPIKNIISSKKGENINFQETGSELGTKLNELLQLQEMSYRMIYDYPRNELDLEFYKGEDKTQESKSDMFITFSASWNNIQDLMINIDESNYKNYYVIAGSGQSDERIIATLDLSNNEYKKKLFIDQRDVKYNPDEQTMEQYKNDLVQKALEKSVDYEIIKNVTFKVIPNGYEYIKDYDLGTKCDVVINDIISFSARIISIFEVFKDGNHTIEIEIGNQIPTNSKNLRK